MFSKIILPEEPKNFPGHVTLKDLDPNVICSVKWNDYYSKSLVILKILSKERSTIYPYIVISFSTGSGIIQEIYSNETASNIKLFDVRPLNVRFEYQDPNNLV